MAFGLAKQSENESALLLLGINWISVSSDTNNAKLGTWSMSQSCIPIFVNASHHYSEGKSWLYGIHGKYCLINFETTPAYSFPHSRFFCNLSCIGFVWSLFASSIQWRSKVNKSIEVSEGLHCWFKKLRRIEFTHMVEPIRCGPCWSLAYQMASYIRDVVKIRQQLVLIT